MTTQQLFYVDETPLHCDTSGLHALLMNISSVPENYTVHFYQTFANPFQDIREKILRENAVLLIDSAIMARYALQFSDISPQKIMPFTAVEQEKSWESVSQVVAFLQRNHISKHDTLIIVGGGITQEVGAFAAGIFKRGIPWIFYPTTLLSMCDSCIGGKASVNFANAKNQLGLFSKPQSVHIYLSFLETLPLEALRSGLGEILKSCLIGGEYFLKIYQGCVKAGKVTSVDDFQTLIHLALMVKKTIVEKDEFEMHSRLALNYGHTVGHAIEALSGYAVAHGSAVVMGMMVENFLSEEYGVLARDERVKIQLLCEALLTEDDKAFLHTLDMHVMWEKIKQDKKSTGNETRFVLLAKPGDVRFVSVPQSCEGSDAPSLALRYHRSSS